jgi:hypothetical protein
VIASFILPRKEAVLLGQPRHSQGQNNPARSISPSTVESHHHFQQWPSDAVNFCLPSAAHSESMMPGALFVWDRQQESAAGARLRRRFRAHVRSLFLARPRPVVDSASSTRLLCLLSRCRIGPYACRVRLSVRRACPPSVLTACASFFTGDWHYGAVRCRRGGGPP